MPINDFPSHDQKTDSLKENFKTPLGISQKSQENNVKKKKLTKTQDSSEKCN